MNAINDGNTSPYDAMADAVRDSMDQLLIPFHVASAEQGPLQHMTTEVFFQKFMVYADKFTGQCCTEFSRILRLASPMPEVRGVPTIHLAKELREAVFEAPDKILIEYLSALKQINIDISDVVNMFADSSIIGEAMKGAVIGRIAGGCVASVSVREASVGLR